MRIIIIIFIIGVKTVCFGQTVLKNPILYKFSPDMSHVVYFVGLDTMDNNEDVLISVKVVLKNLKNNSERVLERKTRMDLSENSVFWINDTLLFFNQSYIYNLGTKENIRLIGLRNVYEYIYIDQLVKNIIYISLFNANLSVMHGIINEKENKIITSKIISLEKYFDDSDYLPDIGIELDWRGSTVYFYDYTIKGLSVYGYNLKSKSLEKTISDYKLNKGSPIRLFITDQIIGFYYLKEKKLFLFNSKEETKKVILKVTSVIMKNKIIYWQKEQNVYSNPMNPKMIYSIQEPGFILKALDGQRLIFVEDCCNGSNLCDKGKAHNIKVHTRLIK